jgi:hypothetical protein
VKFITGVSRVYCGSAICALLIQSWWQVSEPSNFVKLIDHDELKQALIPKGRSPGKHSLTENNGFFVENRLRFSDWPGSSRAKGKARRALVELFRTIGQGLEKWADGVNKAQELNGQSASCQAARNILGPTRDLNFGRYAFVTALKDPARLINTADRYYAL